MVHSGPDEDDSASEQSDTEEDEDIDFTDREAVKAAMKAAFKTAKAARRKKVHTARVKRAAAMWDQMTAEQQSAYFAPFLQRGTELEKSVRLTRRRRARRRRAGLRTT